MQARTQDALGGWSAASFDVFPTPEPLAVRSDRDDRLAPARGLLLGFVLGAGLWLGLVWLIFRLI